MLQYFKEYYLLEDKYQRIAQNSGGFGLVSGFFLYWIGWGKLLSLVIGQAPIGQPRELSGWVGFLVFIGLPLSIWAGMIAMAFLFAVRGQITTSDAVSLGFKFTYPRHWLKNPPATTTHDDATD